MAQRNTYFQDEEVKEEKIDVKNLRRLIGYVLPHKKLFILVLLLMLITVASSLVSPLLLKYLINFVIPESSYKKFFWVLSGFVVAGLVEIFITFYQQRSMGRMGHGVIAEIRKDIFY